MKNNIKFGIILTLCALLTACSSGPTIHEFADTANPTTETQQLETDMNTAIQNQVNVLSPHNFEEAQESLASAKKSLDQQKSAKETLHQVAEGRAYLVRSNEFAQAAHLAIEDVVQARQNAIQAGAVGFFTLDFNKADHHLKDVTAEIEKNKPESATKNRLSLQAAYLDLELKAIKETSIGPSRDIIALSIKEDAKIYAPRSLAIAQKSISDTDAFINANRHDTEALKIKSHATQNSADHLLVITRKSKLSKKTSSEDSALTLEGEENKVVAKQIQLNQKQGQLDRKQDQLAKEQDTTQALSEENKNLASEQAFNRSFDEARAEFTASEAEVYKQGNTLMIRLRGLEFPTDQAVLKGSNFPLLAKVQKVINDFGKSSVIVEGHTDSRGGKLLNEKLSTARALAVKEYFVSNEGTEALSIKSIGYGYQKPLATNKTASGRAQNRRVDILIQAEAPSKQ